MDTGERVLAAAARVYGAAGYPGATTRRIAAEAHVREAALLERFRSRDALLRAAFAALADPAGAPALPDEPRDPARELAAWCAATHEWVHARRAVLCRLLGEMSERPELAEYAVEALRRSIAAVAAYLARLAAVGGLRPLADRWSAAAVLARAVFAQALADDATGAAGAAGAAHGEVVRAALASLGLR